MYTLLNNCRTSWQGKIHNEITIFILLMLILNIIICDIFKCQNIKFIIVLSRISLIITSFLQHASLQMCSGSCFWAPLIFNSNLGVIWSQNQAKAYLNAYFYDWLYTTRALHTISHMEKKSNTCATLLVQNSTLNSWKWYIFLQERNQVT